MNSFFILFMAAAPVAPVVKLADLGSAGGQVQMSMPIQIMLLLTFLTFIPAIVISLSSFTRIIIVFHFLRQAMGTQEAPSNQILVGLALFLSFFIMNPTLTKIYDDAYIPWSKGQINEMQAVEKGTGPLKLFMMKSTPRKRLEAIRRHGRCW